MYLYVMENGAVYCDGVFGIVNEAGEINNIMGDDLFPALSLQGYFPLFISVIFMIGLVSALFPSADGALTSLTSSFCVDLLKLNENDKLTEKQRSEERRVGKENNTQRARE